MLFRSYIRKFILVFFDDILIYSKSQEEHAQHLKLALEVLRQHNLYLRLNKCTFVTPQVTYLGYVISAQGVSTNPEKIQDILNWPVPTSATKLRGVLGVTGYYRRFINNYGIICRPLFDALKKDAFCWGPEQDAAFNKLKLAMTTCPVLALPNFSLPFIIEADGCASGIGDVLMQQGHPLAFMSKGLGPKAAAQSVYEKEAIAILETLKKWRHYLLGNKLIIKTDHESLKHMTTQRLIRSEETRLNSSHPV